MNTLNRRELLKSLSAVALGAPLANWAAEDLRTKARKNLKLAVFTGVYAKLPLEEAARHIRADGFHGVVNEGLFADVRFDPLAPDWDAARKITDTLERHELKVAGLYGYYNVVDPDPARRRRGERRMELLIQNWKRLGSPIISTETGTLNRESEWEASSENATEAAYQQCRAAFERWARASEQTGAILTIEPYWKNVIDSAQRAERLFRDVKSPSLKLVMDPCNYFRKEELPRMEERLQDLFRRVGNQTALAHAKDVKASADGTDLPASGLGVLDYPLYLRLLAGLDRELFLAVEHLGIDDVARARDYVLSQFAKI